MGLLTNPLFKNFLIKTISVLFIKKFESNNSIDLIFNFFILKKFL